MTTIFKTIGLEAVSYVIDGRGVSEEMVEVDYDAEKYKMKEIPETRKMIETIWAERTKRNSRIFNQSKFRLAHHSWDSASLKLKMKVGITDYKDHVGTNLSPDVQKYLGTGDEKFDMMSQCVGVGCWVVTLDQKVVFVENAAWKGEQACKVDRPGGHAEPDDCKKNGDTIENDVVRRELFDCIQRELRDEINISMDLQEAPELLGVIYNHGMGGRLSLDFLIKCNVDSEEVLKLYKQGGIETDESTQLFFKSKDDVQNDQLDSVFTQRFTPHCEASINLLKERLQHPL